MNLRGDRHGSICGAKRFENYFPGNILKFFSDDKLSHVIQLAPYSAMLGTTRNLH